MRPELVCLRNNTLSLEGINNVDQPRAMPLLVFGIFMDPHPTKILSHLSSAWVLLPYKLPVNQPATRVAGEGNSRIFLRTLITSQEGEIMDGSMGLMA